MSLRLKRGLHQVSKAMAVTEIGNKAEREKVHAHAKKGLDSIFFFRGENLPRLFY